MRTWHPYTMLLLPYSIENVDTQQLCRGQNVLCELTSFGALLDYADFRSKSALEGPNNFTTPTHGETYFSLLDDEDNQIAGIDCVFEVYFFQSAVLLRELE